MMKIFYRELLAGSTIAAALRLSQLETLANPETSHPYYWAAFRMIGHPANPFSSLQTPGGGDRASAT
jgi:CHAT domain-containing protein